MSIKTEVIYEEDSTVESTAVKVEAMDAEIGQVWSNGADMLILTMGEDCEMRNLFMNTKAHAPKVWHLGMVRGHEEIRAFLLNSEYTFLCDLGEIARELSEL